MRMQFENKILEKIILHLFSRIIYKNIIFME